jgi:hypothetical protein
MNNPLKIIASAGKGIVLADIVRDCKKYTSKQIEPAIRENPFESRKECLPVGSGGDVIACPEFICGFNPAGQRNSNSKNFNFGNRIIIPSSYTVMTYYNKSCYTCITIA